MAERYSPLKGLRYSLDDIILVTDFYLHPEKLTQSDRYKAQQIVNHPDSTPRYFERIKIGVDYLIRLTEKLEREYGIDLLYERNNLQSHDRGLQRLERRGGWRTLPLRKVASIAKELKGLYQSVEQKARERLPKRKLIPEATETVAIVLISTVGLASLLYLQSGPTARVIEPTIANLPLGISFLAILVIAIMAISRR